MRRAAAGDTVITPWGADECREIMSEDARSAGRAREQRLAQQAQQISWTKTWRIRRQEAEIQEERIPNRTP